MAAMLRMRDSVEGTEGHVLRIRWRYALSAFGELDIGHSKRTEQYVKAYTLYIVFMILILQRQGFHRDECQVYYDDNVGM
jgi:hypothetical protein